eukprot:jgi/Mesvir1/20766/Mv07887-RA.1
MCAAAIHGQLAAKAWFDCGSTPRDQQPDERNRVPFRKGFGSSLVFRTYHRRAAPLPSLRPTPPCICRVPKDGNFGLPMGGRDLLRRFPRPPLWTRGAGGAHVRPPETSHPMSLLHRLHAIPNRVAAGFPLLGFGRWLANNLLVLLACGAAALLCPAPVHAVIVNSSDLGRTASSASWHPTGTARDPGRGASAPGGPGVPRVDSVPRDVTSGPIPRLDLLTGRPTQGGPGQATAGGESLETELDVDPADAEASSELRLLRLMNGQVAQGLSLAQLVRLWERASLGFLYRMEMFWEQFPSFYLYFLFLLTLSLCLLGGLIIYGGRMGILINGKPRVIRDFPDAVWKAWSFLCGAYVMETQWGPRLLGLALFLGGVMTFSLLTSSLSVQMKARLEDVRMGLYPEVTEVGHVVVVGVNEHLLPLLKQLDHSYAARGGGLTRQPAPASASLGVTSVSKSAAVPGGRVRLGRLSPAEWPLLGPILRPKQTVIVLTDRERSQVEAKIRPLCRQLRNLNVLVRTGDLSSRWSYRQAAVSHARCLVVLADRDEESEVDAEAILRVLALRKLAEGEGGPTVVVQVLRSNTARIIEGLGGLRLGVLEDMSSRLLVQCARQKGLAAVYHQLLANPNTSFCSRHYPEMAGLRYGQIRKALREGVLVGVITPPPPPLPLHESAKATDPALPIQFNVPHTGSMAAAGVSMSADASPAVVAAAERPVTMGAAPRVGATAKGEAKGPLMAHPSSLSGHLSKPSTAGAAGGAAGGVHASHAARGHGSDVGGVGAKAPAPGLGSAGAASFYHGVGTVTFQPAESQVIQPTDRLLLLMGRHQWDRLPPSLWELRRQADEEARARARQSAWDAGSLAARAMFPTYWRRWVLPGVAESRDPVGRDHGSIPAHGGTSSALGFANNVRDGSRRSAGRPEKAPRPSAGLADAQGQVARETDWGAAQDAMDAGVRQAGPAGAGVKGEGGAVVPLGSLGTNPASAAARVAAGQPAHHSLKRIKSVKHATWNTLDMDDGAAPQPERFLMCGWREGVAEMAFQLDASCPPGSEMLVLSEQPVDARQRVMRARLGKARLRNLRLRHVLGSPTSGFDLQAALVDCMVEREPLHQGSSSERRGSLHAATAGGWSHHPVSSARNMAPDPARVAWDQDCHVQDVAVSSARDSLPLGPYKLTVFAIREGGWYGSRADKQTLFSVLQVDNICRSKGIYAYNLVAEVENRKLGEGVAEEVSNVTSVSTTDLMARLTGQVVENTENNAVWGELLSKHGFEIGIRDVGVYMDPFNEDLSFREISERAWAMGEIAIGYHNSSQGVVLNPQPQSQSVKLGVKGSVVVLHNPHAG